jgi:hypothetical protein
LKNIGTLTICLSRKWIASLSSWRMNRRAKARRKSKRAESVLNAKQKQSKTMPIVPRAQSPGLYSAFGGAKHRERC